MKVAVKLKGSPEIYTGWIECEITRSLDDATSTFNMLTVNDDAANGLTSGDTVEITYGTDTVMTGYIDTVFESYTSTDHTFQISGRSLTEDLVDCSAVPNEWVKTKLSQIASAIVKPHNVQLKVLGDPTIEKFTIKKDDSETVIDAIHQLANNEGMIVYDSPKGELVIGPVGSKSGNYLKNKKDDEQSNVLSGEHKDDMSNRFYEIQVRSQTKGTDESFGTKNQQIQAIANDKTIRPNRVLIIDAPRPLNQIEAQKLANWQNAANCGKSIEFTYDVFGWKGPVELWAINTLINVEDDFYVVKVPMLISKVVFKISESGTTTSLTLNPPSAYIPNPIQDKEPVGKVKKGRKKGKKSKEPVVFWKEEDGV